MTSQEFDPEEAKKFLKEREEKIKDRQDTERKQLLEKVILILKEELKNTSLEVFLVGSITRPFSFTSRSDVDIVLKSFHGDRFDLCARLEKKIGRSVEIIIFETCGFQEFILKEGFKVI